MLGEHEKSSEITRPRLVNYKLLSCSLNIQSGFITPVNNEVIA